MLHRKVKHGDKITIGESEVHVRKVKGAVVLSIKAPKEVAIEHRGKKKEAGNDTASLRST